MDIMSQFNLPTYLKGKSFSEASKLIADRFKDRNTPEDVATLKELQGRLQSAQEFVKAKQQVNVPQEGGDMHQMPDGSMMPGATHGEAPQEQQQVDPAMMQAMQESMPQGDAYGYGGYKKSYAYGGKMDKENAANKYEHGGPHFGELSKFLEGSNGLLNRGVDSSNLNGLNAAQYIQDDGLGNMMSSFGGEAMAPRTYAGLPNLSSFPAQNSKEPQQQPATQPDPVTGERKPLPMPTQLDSYGRQQSTSKDFANQELSKGVDTSGLKPIGDLGSFSGNDTDEGVNKSRQSKFNPGELLRYAAPASTAYQLANLNKPKDVSLGRMTDKYDEQFVDEKAMQNVVEGQAANTRSALQNASGGSASALRANLLGSQVQSQAAMSQAYNQAAAENRNERKAGQQFNSAVNQANMAQADKETEMNLVQKAGYETNKSRLLAQLGADASGIGQEELFKRFPELAGLGYDYKGRKIKTK
tara:strand:+ start:82 stop:1494 length:1413 start_codon:yes stop_codon:yes gene_type:complete